MDDTDDEIEPRRAKPEDARRGYIILAIIGALGAIYVYQYVIDRYFNFEGFATGLLAGLILSGLFLWWAIRKQGVSLRGSAKYNRCVRLVNNRRYTEAATELDKILDHEGENTVIYSSAWYLRGMLHLIQAEMAQAAAALETSAKSRHFKKMMIQADVYSRVAAAFALKGDLTAARHWLGAREKYRDKCADETCLATGIVFCRENRFTEAVQVLSERYLSTETAVGVIQAKTLRLVYAFALSNLPNPPQKLLEQLIAGVSPAIPGEFKYLGVCWPEMRVFLSAHGLNPDEQKPGLFPGAVPVTSEAARPANPSLPVS